MSAFRFVDLYAGIGGFRGPFQDLGGACVYSAERDRFCRETYLANFPETEGHRFGLDLSGVAPEDVPPHDVLLAGFPCQPFSSGGIAKRRSLGLPSGFADKSQGTAFHDLARIIAHRRPAAFLLENVPNIEKHDGGRTWEIIRETLAGSLRYALHTKVISSAPWVPQRRRRLFMVGFREPSGFDFARMKEPSGPAPTLGTILEEDAPAKYTLSARLWEGLQRRKKWNEDNGTGFGFSLFGPENVARTLSARYGKDGSEILIKQAGKRPRRLTPRECARLMGFERPGGPPFAIPVSDTQAYRQFGNAVVPPLVRSIAEIMLPAMKTTEPYAISDCVQCGDPILPERRRGRSRVRTCSERCAAELRERHARADRIRRRKERAEAKGGRGPCLFCGNPIPWQRHGSAKTCSTGCGKELRLLRAQRRNAAWRARRRAAAS